jgi:hypothetical protein
MRPAQPRSPANISWDDWPRNPGMRGESQRAVSAHKRDDATINGFTTDEAELPAKINGKKKLADPAIDPSLIEVLRYEFLGGPLSPSTGRCSSTSRITPERRRRGR